MPFNSTDTDRKHRLHRRTILRKSVITAGGLVLGVGAVSADDEPQTFSVPLIGECRSTPCIGEEVCITQGVANVKIHTTSDMDGGFHFTYHSHWDPLVRAVGQTSGTVWTAQGVIAGSEQLHLHGQFPQTIHFMDHAMFTSDGPTDNFLLHINFHATVNGDGEVTAFRDEERMECTG